MKLTEIYILVLFLNILFYCDTSKAQTLQKSTIKDLTETNQPPIAINDTFVLFTGCDRNSISGDIFSNDFDPDGDKIALLFIVTPKVGEFSINNKGEFSFTIPNGYLGTLKFEYYIIEIGENDYKDMAEVVIFVKPDHDCDNISDEDDIDDDNDGILDKNEGDGEIDSDLDRIPDSFDIDSDNDGITDNEEWQREGFFIEPTGNDINLNGWDDAYDSFLEGYYYKAEDTNKDGTPDFIDIDSDKDGISDIIEGYDINKDGLPDINPLNIDSDGDGLDDAFDIISDWIAGGNSTGSNAPLPDLNKNGIREWRDSKNGIPEEENFFSADLIFLYPNPSQGKFAVNLPISNEEETVNFFLFSMTGKLLFEKIITTQQNNIDATNIGCGIYFAKIQSNTFTHTESLIINR